MDALLPRVSHGATHVTPILGGDSLDMISYDNKTTQRIYLQAEVKPLRGAEVDQVKSQTLRIQERS